MKVLICGNGPSLLGQLRGRSLDTYDKVVRMNEWKEIPEYDNRCDVWVFYPLHDINEAEHKYNIRPYLHIKENWLVHPIVLSTFKKCLDKDPDKILTQKEITDLECATGLYKPRTGILVLWLALILNYEVHAAGFDFYQGDRTYYYKPGKDKIASNNKVHPDPLIEKRWFDMCVERGLIKNLKESII